MIGLNICLMLSKNTFTKDLARKLKKVREEKRISQEELADKAELYRTYIGHIENGRYTPSAYVVYKIAEVLKVKLSDLYP